MNGSTEGEAGISEWLLRFRAGDRNVLAECYEQHYETVDRSVSRVLKGADRETVVQEVFLRLIERDDVRARFSGADVGPWIARVATNLAIDFARRNGRELPLERVPETLPEGGQNTTEGDLIAEQLTQAFRQQLPEGWRAVFDARFLEQRTQREAATHLGMRRTTLAYQELRIRARLKAFLFGD